MMYFREGPVDDVFTQNVIANPMISRCYGEYCKALGWTGDMDLVGIGVKALHLVSS